MEYSPSLGIEVEEAMKMGSYEADGTANRVIDIGFTPKVIWIYPTNPTDTAAAVATTANYSTSFNGQAWEKAKDHFQGIVPNGFKTGMSATGLGTNTNAYTYFWIAQ